MTVRIGSLFSGIGGFELGLERAIPGAVTVWQCEQNDFCQKVLKKHWPGVTIYNDVKDINEKVEPIDLLCGGFPCQSISKAGNRKGLSDENKSGLWFEMWRVISILRPRIICLENVANIIRVGGCDVVGSLAKIGYNCEWTVISASDIGAPHKRSRWFCVGWDTSAMSDQGQSTPHPDSNRFRTSNTVQSRGPTLTLHDTKRASTHPDMQRSQKQSTHPQSVEKTSKSKCGSNKINWDNKGGSNYWEGFPIESPLCRRNDGLPHRVDRIRALGNAIVPQCSEWVGRQIVKSGLLNDLIGGEV